MHDEDDWAYGADRVPPDPAGATLASIPDRLPDGIRTHVIDEDYARGSIPLDHIAEDAD